MSVILPKGTNEWWILKQKKGACSPFVSFFLGKFDRWPFPSTDQLLRSFDRPTRWCPRNALITWEMSRPGVHGFLAASNGLVKNIVEDFGIRNPPRTQFRSRKEFKDFLLKNMYSILVVTVTGRSYSKSQVISSLQYFYCYIYHFHLQLRCFSTINFRFPFRLLFSVFFAQTEEAPAATVS